jgi:hypothetical protein
MDQEPPNKRQREDATDCDELSVHDQLHSGAVKSSDRDISETSKPYDALKEYRRTDRATDSPTSDISEQCRRNDPGVTSPLTHPNGISMFPEMSVTEQEAMSRQALAQAEETIVADSDEYNSTDDAGYGSDNMSSASTSIGSSVRDYMFENGRRYHSFRAGAYNFPNDDVEQEREDMKHAMVRLLSGQKLHFAPLGDNPQNILDIGTGTGIWAIESKTTLLLHACTFRQLTLKQWASNIPVPMFSVSTSRPYNQLGCHPTFTLWLTMSSLPGFIPRITLIIFIPGIPFKRSKIGLGC